MDFKSSPHAQNLKWFIRLAFTSVCGSTWADKISLPRLNTARVLWIWKQSQIWNTFLVSKPRPVLKANLSQRYIPSLGNQPNSQRKRNVMHSWTNWRECGIEADLRSCCQTWLAWLKELIERIDWRNWIKGIDWECGIDADLRSCSVRLDFLPDWRTNAKACRPVLRLCEKFQLKQTCCFLPD